MGSQLHKQMKVKQKQRQKAERHAQHLAMTAIAGPINTIITQGLMQKPIH